MTWNTPTIGRRDMLQAIGTATATAGGLSGTSAAESDTFIVENGESIQDAIDDADNGDTIKLMPGRYEVTGLTVPKTLSIIGKPGSTDIGPSDDAPVIVPKSDDDREGISFRRDGESSGSGSTVRGFVFQGFEFRGISGGQAADEITIEDNHFKNLGNGVVTFGNDRKYVGWTIRRNRVTKANRGFRLANIHDTTVENNRVAEVERAGIFVNANDRDPDIGVSNVKIVDNQIEDCYFGVYLLARNDRDPDETIEITDLTVTGNEVSNAARLAYRFSVGTNLDSGAVATIQNVVTEGNTVRESNAGFRIDTNVDEGARHLVYRNNNVSDVKNFGFNVACDKASSDSTYISGITYEDNSVTAARTGFKARANAGRISSVTFNGNKATETEYGVLVNGSDPGNIEEFALNESTLLENEVGVLVRTGAQGISLRRNRIEGNEFGAINQESNQRLDAVKNYWGSPNGPERSNPASNTNGEKGQTDTIGDGDRVLGNIKIKPWLAQPP